MRWMLQLLVVVVALVTFAGCGRPAASRPWSVRMADSVMARHADPATIELTDDAAEPKWSYSASFAVYAVAQVGVRSGDARYIDYARRYMNEFVDDRGGIKTRSYVPSNYKLDDIAPGRVLLLLHDQTREPRWLNATQPLVEQLRRQPRTADGGLWHKKIYPHQLWLDGIFMDCPFMTDYAAAVGDSKWFDEAVHQILTVAKHTSNTKTGLHYHGWDESRFERWADRETGLSQCFWGRGVGWFAMGIVETLERLPANHPRRNEVLAVLQRVAEAIAGAQDPATGVWYQVLDQPGRVGNYLESSASAMFVFALAKAARLGFIDRRYADIARRGYDGILKQFVEVDVARGLVTLKDTCRVAGLGGNPYRDGSFEYYVNEPKISNDPKGIAPFILASLELER